MSGTPADTCAAPTGAEVLTEVLAGAGVDIHTTVGTLNGASQVCDACRDGSPVVVIAGHQDRAVLSEDGFCAHPYLPGPVRPFTKRAHQTLSGGDLWRMVTISSGMAAR